MPNHLINENSPYLLQHANNPVDWYPWGEESLTKARAENKPIFLSIGYAACHWCHVMAHESFEDEETAAFMNEHFVNIKVDREERPDIDAIYMQATVAMTGQGGWPMSVFLTPDLRPFYTGTYFPPVRRYNMPSFKEVLLSLAKAWREERDEVDRVGSQVLQHIQPQTLGQDEESLTPETLEAATKFILESYDWGYGGWGAAPKFPQPMTIEFLLRRALTDSPQREQILKASVHVLNAMSRGGMYDVVGGGFSRYSVDNFWRTPHFEKMLYDNAQLALAYLHGYLVTRDMKYRWVCEETLDFILRELTHPDGGFYSSLDADSEGEEGRFYVWTQDEIQNVLGSDFEFFKTAYGITPQGNWEGKTILQRALDDSTLVAHFNLDRETLRTQLLVEAHAKLLAARSGRVRPGTDDKVLVMWNALALSAFAEAGRYLGRQDYLDAARRNARFLLDNLYVSDRLWRSWREGQAKHNAYLEDYAGLVLGLLALYQSDPNPEWYKTALILADEMVAHFADPDGGFFDTRDDHEALLVRPRDIQDNATPSGNALAATALLQLATYGDRDKWRSVAEEMLMSIQSAFLRYPTSFAQWLAAADFAVGPIREVAIIGDLEDAKTQSLLKTLWKDYRPGQVAAISAYPPGPGSPTLLQNRPLLNNEPTAYVCQGFVCLQPVNLPEQMEIQLMGKVVR